MEKNGIYKMTEEIIFEDINLTNRKHYLIVKNIFGAFFFIFMINMAVKGISLNIEVYVYYIFLMFLMLMIYFLLNDAVLIFLRKNIILRILKDNNIIKLEGFYSNFLVTSNCSIAQVNSDYLVRFFLKNMGEGEFVCFTYDKKNKFYVRKEANDINKLLDTIV